MKTILSIFFSASLMLSCTSVCRAALATFSFTGASGAATFPPDAPQPANGTVGDMTRGSGVIPAIANGDEFSGAGWSTTTRDLNDYFSFTITPNAGFEMTLTRLELDENRNANGIRNWQIYSSLDGFTTALGLATFTVPDDLNTRVNEGADFSLSSASAVEFRIYGYTADQPFANVWSIDNVDLSGSLTAVPEPVTWALIVFGATFGAVQLGRLYRRRTAG